MRKLPLGGRSRGAVPAERAGTAPQREAARKGAASNPGSAPSSVALAVIPVDLAPRAAWPLWTFLRREADDPRELVSGTNRSLHPALGGVDIAVIVENLLDYLRLIFPVVALHRLHQVEILDGEVVGVEPEIAPHRSELRRLQRR